jgi:type VI secretion system lysozyme-like protein
MTLFAEIAGISPSSPPRLREEVGAHLRRMCSTRRASLLLAPAYGVDDVTRLFHSFPGGLEGWRANLEEAIRLYEPRLRAVRVTPITGEPADLKLRFEIQGELVVDGSPGAAEPVNFRAAANASLDWVVA